QREKRPISRVTAEAWLGRPRRSKVAKPTTYLRRSVPTVLERGHAIGESLLRDGPRGDGEGAIAPSRRRRTRAGRTTDFGAPPPRNLPTHLATSGPRAYRRIPFCLSAPA